MSLKKSVEIERFLKEVRKCKECEVNAGISPLIFSAGRLKILMVSEMPSKSAYKNQGAEK
jgi:hypothetical protein